MNHAMAAKAPPGYGSNRRRSTSLKLWMGVVATNLVGLFSAFYVANTVRAGTGDPDLLLPIYYGTMVLAGLADALWLDEIAFKGAFRRSLQGKVGGKNADVEDVAAELQRPAVGFPVVAVFCTLLTYGMFNLVNHGFDSWWRDTGKQINELRHGADTATRVDAIRELSRRNQPEILEIFERHLSDEDPTVAAWSAWAIGRQKALKNPAMNINRVPPLVDRFRNGPPEVRREALLALGRMQHRPMAKPIAEALAAELEGDGTVDIRLVWALGYVQHPDTLTVLDRALFHDDERIQRTAAWALAQQRDSGKGREAADLLEQRLPAAPFATKCAIIHSLAVLTDERSNLALMHAYDGLTPEQRKQTCELLAIGIAPDGQSDYENILMPPEAFGLKTLQAMGRMRATTPEIRAEVEPWLEGLIASEQTDPIEREAARDLLAGIRQQRDDR